MSMLTPRGAGGLPGVRRAGTGRRAAVAALALLAIAAGSWAAWTYTTGQEPSVRAQPRRSCPAPVATLTGAAPGQVRVNVYNATDRRGLAARVAGQLERRGFRVKKVDNDPAGRTVTSAAEVRHSASEARAARTVAAQVGAVVEVLDGRENATVDLVLGAAFTRLSTAEDAAAALAAQPRPELLQPC